MNTLVYPTRVTLEQALQIIAVQATRQRMPIEALPLARAQGRVLAEDIHAPCALPPISNTAADGFALHTAGVPPAGELALGSGMPLGAAQLAVLTALGTARVGVRRQPRVAMISIVGDLASAGQSLGRGQTHAPNAGTLTARAHASGLHVAAQACVRNEPMALRAALLDAAADADIVVTSGGVSAADTDHLPRVLSGIGEVHFHKVRVNPGMPTLFGQMGACLYFGLPDTPLDAAVAFRVFVGFALRAMLGITQVPEPIRVRLAEPLHKRRPCAEFTRCTLHADADGVQWVTPYPTQDTCISLGLADTHALALLPEGERDYQRGDVVTLWPT